MIDVLDIEDLKVLMGDSCHKNDGRTQEQSAMWQITDSLRGYGFRHEWLPVSQAVIAKQWGVTAEQIKAWTTPTANTYFYNILDSDGNIGEGFHNKNKHVSHFAHAELIKAMQDSNNLEDYKVWLNNWADEHVVLAVNDGNGNIKKIKVYGREALPEGLRLPSDYSELPSDSPNKSKPMDVSPKSDCGS